MYDNEIKSPIWEKPLLTIEEASKYSGIGTTKIRSLCNEKRANFFITKDKKILIIREKFDLYIERRFKI